MGGEERKKKRKGENREECKLCLSTFFSTFRGEGSRLWEGKKKRREKRKKEGRK